MNYKELLLKYMQHLLQVEDSLFLELINSPFSNINFTEEEVNCLRALEKLIETGTALGNA